MIEEARVSLYLFSLNYSLVKEASSISIYLTYYIKDIQSVTRYSNHFRVIEIVSLLEPYSH
jgi:hypothetical protein